MIKLLQTSSLAIGLLLGACTGKDGTSQTPTTVNYAFTKEELTGLIMVTQGYLDGHLPETGHLREGATLLIFEQNFAWAIGKTSPKNLQGKHTKFSWKLNSHGN